MNDAHGARSSWEEQLVPTSRTWQKSHGSEHDFGAPAFEHGWSLTTWMAVRVAEPSFPPVEREPRLCTYASIDAYSRMPPELCEVLARLYGPRPSFAAVQYERWKDNAPLVLWLRGTLDLPREARAAVLAEINDLRCRAHAAYLQELRA